MFRVPSQTVPFQNLEADMAAKVAARLLWTPQTVKTRLFSKYVPGCAVFSFSMSLKSGLFHKWKQDDLLKLSFLACRLLACRGLSSAASKNSTLQDHPVNRIKVKVNFSFRSQEICVCVFCIPPQQTATLNIFEGCLCLFVLRFAVSPISWVFCARLWKLAILIIIVIAILVRGKTYSFSHLFLAHHQFKNLWNSGFAKSRPAWWRWWVWIRLTF